MYKRDELGRIIVAENVPIVFTTILKEEGEECDWVTTDSGAHVCISGDGQIMKGPSSMKGQNIKDLKDDNPEGQDKKNKFKDKKDIHNEVDKEFNQKNKNTPFKGNAKNYRDFKDEMAKKLGVEKEHADIEDTLNEYASIETRSGKEPREKLGRLIQDSKDGKANKAFEMNQNINQKYLNEKFPKSDEITLYRGINKGENTDYKGRVTSWTSNKKVAQDFADYKMDGEVVERKISKKDIYFTSGTSKKFAATGVPRSEKEFLVYEG